MTSLIKSLLQYILFPVGCFFWLLSLLIGFPTLSQFVSRFPGKTGNMIRYWFYKMSLKSMGNNVTISYGCLFTNKDITIGNNVRLGPYNTVALADLGDNILTAQFVHFLSGKNHHGYGRTDIPMIEQPGKLERINIADDIWIGANCVIMADIKKGTIVGSGSVVTKSFGGYDIIAGNPAKVIKNRISSGREHE